MRLVPDCAAELLGSDDCAFAIAVASVAYGAEVPASEQQPASALYKLDLENWVCDRLTRKDRELFAAKILSFVQVNIFVGVCIYPSVGVKLMEYVER